MEGAEAVLPLCRPLPERIFTFVLECRLDLVDAMHHRPELFHGTLVLGADDFLQNPIEHGGRGKVGGKGRAAWMKIG